MLFPELNKERLIRLKNPIVRARLKNFHAPLRSASDILSLAERLEIPERIVDELLSHLANVPRPRYTRVEMEEAIASNNMTCWLIDRGQNVKAQTATLLNAWESADYQVVRTEDLADWLGVTRTRGIYGPLDNLTALLMDSFGEVCTTYPGSQGLFGSLVHEDIMRKRFEFVRRAETLNRKNLLKLFGGLR